LILLGHLSHEGAESKLVVALRNQFKPVLGYRFEPVLTGRRADWNELFVFCRRRRLVVVVVFDVQASFRRRLASVLLGFRRFGYDVLIGFARVVK
jgi:hypothetical protein